MLQQVTAEVQPRLAAQVNTAVSLDRTRMYGEYHVLSSLLLLLIYTRVLSMTKHISHTCGRSCRPARYICQVVLITAILTIGVYLYRARVLLDKKKNVPDVALKMCR